MATDIKPGQRFVLGLDILDERIAETRTSLAGRQCHSAIDMLNDGSWWLGRLDAIAADAAQRRAIDARAQSMRGLRRKVELRCARKAPTGKAKRSRQKAGLGGLLAGALAGFIGGRLTKK